MSRLAQNRSWGDSGLGLGIYRVRLGCDGRSVSHVARGSAAIGVSAAALLIVLSNPVAAYEGGWGLWQNPVVQPEFRMQVPRQAPPRTLHSGRGPKGKHVIEKVQPPEKIPAGP